MRTAMLLSVFLAAVFSPACSTFTDHTRGAAMEEFEITVVLVEAPTETAAAWLVPTIDEARIVSTEDAAKFLSMAQSDGEVISRLRLIVPDGMPAELSETKRFEYVSDFSQEARPIPAALDEGFRVLASVTRAPDGRAALTFSAENSVLQRPVREATVKLQGTEREGTLQLPELQIDRRQETVALDANEAALVRLNPLGAKHHPRARFAVLYAQRTQPPRAGRLP